MRRWTPAIAALVVFAASTPVTADSGDPRLHITVAPGTADLEFRGLGLNPDAFMVRGGGDRSFSVKPGRVVVVQAPPVAGVLTVECSDGEFAEHHLAEGDEVSCTYRVDG